MNRKLNIREIKHLYWRAGFGSTPKDIEVVNGKPASAIVNKLFMDSKTFSPIKLGKESKLDTPQEGKMSKEMRKESRKKNRLKIMNVNHEWLMRMGTSSAFLREKMTFFWHDHFPSEFIFVKPILLQNNTLREHALGNFRMLLHAISKDPLMLVYLNNQQNKKGAPNENFAREVMELFTLGEGHYTESDIKEAARAFTGWQTNFALKYKFREQEHDFGEKTIFGKTAKFSGEDVIDLILENKQTARYIAGKLYKFMVNEIPNQEHIELLATQFYESDYDISTLLKSIFLSDWFYEEKNMGARIKSPIELIAGLNKQFSLEYPDSKIPIMAQKVMGQILLKPPNVAGWPSGRAWIDSSTLLYRMKLPQLFLAGTEIPIEAKASFDAAEKGIYSKYKKKGEEIARVKWDGFLSHFMNFGKSERLSKVAELLFNTSLDPEIEQAIELKLSSMGEETALKVGTIVLLGMPEYQTC